MQYQESSNRSIFSETPVKQLIPNYVDRPWEAGSSMALKEFENKWREKQHSWS